MYPWAFVALTVASGIIDAASYLALGHVFVANTTGNVVFIGFALAGDRDISIVGSLVAMAAFVLGAYAGGGLARRTPEVVRLLLRANTIELLVTLAALAIAIAVPLHPATAPVYAVTALLASAMGMRNAAIRKIAVPDFTTTVLTLTVTGIAADFAGTFDAKTARRAASLVAMFGGALVGAALVLRAGLIAALIAIAAVLAASIATVLVTGRR